MRYEIVLLHRTIDTRDSGAWRRCRSDYMKFGRSAFITTKKTRPRSCLLDPLVLHELGRHQHVLASHSPRGEQVFDQWGTHKDEVYHSPGKDISSGNSSSTMTIEADL
jgi:hypothetical protein